MGVAESALAQLGFRRIPRVAERGSAFWVEEAESPRKSFPVFLWEGGFDPPASEPLEWRRRTAAADPIAPAIFVVPSDRVAEAVLGERSPRATIPSELRILVIPRDSGAARKPHWHSLVLAPRDLLEVATGVVVGLFRRAQASEGGSEVDFQEMLQILKHTFRIDLRASLGVDSDEAALFLLYQLAQKYAFAPGDPAANLHTLVLRPTGPAARLPWFAA